MRGTIAHGFTALLAAVNDYKASLGVGERLYRAQYSAAIVCSVAGVDINMERA